MKTPKRSDFKTKARSERNPDIKSNFGRRRWIKLWVDSWLSGTMRFTLNHKQRSVWADLLALGGQSRVSGVICSGEERGQIVGMPLLRIAGSVDVPPDELDEMLKLFEAQERIRIEHENGRLIIHILNWSRYQADYSRQNKYKERKRREKGEATTKATEHGYAKATSAEVEVEVEGEGEGEGEVVPAAFSSIGHERPFGQRKFQEIWLKNYSNRESLEWLTMSMEATIQECLKKHIGIPPQFYSAKRDVEARENEVARQKYKRTPL
jgi:hypothetical protein